MLIKEIMRRRVFSVSPGMTLREAARLFEERGISGAPVVSSAGDVLGVLSRTDFAGIECGENRRVEQAMTPYAVSFEEDTPVREVARQMLAKRIHRVIVTKNGAIIGIATSLDLLKALT
jgi:CBS domain-containing protein